MSTNALQLVRELRAAEDAAQPFPRPSERVGVDLATAYEIQRLRLAPQPDSGGGTGVGGHLVVRSCGDGEWVTGRLNPGRLVASGAVPVPAAGTVTVEPAVALVVGRTLRGPHTGAADVQGVLTQVRGALVVRVDRYGSDSVIDEVSDNLGAHAVAVSARSVALGDLDLGVLGYTVHAAGALQATGAVASAAGWVNATISLLDRLAASGEELRPGSVLVVGSLAPALPVAAAVTVTATFARIGALTAHLSPES
ncbi:hypothetical protein L1080_037095 [Rhodococcus sp. MSC1_016]|uniref:hypothetical protein n=1 Tax=Rhodococcus sp. MSC1_016 TaxID=2909266 RepID=UPI00202E3744|nr:hypothetical protein [Rhodococcus sp. MSC1_016]